jgi:predicted nucleic-acid-binding Zn-ribbon protein
MADQRMKVNIDLKKTTGVTCDRCGAFTFQEGLMLRKVSRFLTGEAQDGVIPIPTFICTKCGHVNKDFYPKDLIEDEQE